MTQRNSKGLSANLSATDPTPNILGKANKFLRAVTDYVRQRPKLFARQTGRLDCNCYTPKCQEKANTSQTKNNHQYFRGVAHVRLHRLNCIPKSNPKNIGVRFRGTLDDLKCRVRTFRAILDDLKCRVRTFRIQKHRYPKKK